MLEFAHDIRRTLRTLRTCATLRVVPHPRARTWHRALVVGALHTDGAVRGDGLQSDARQGDE